VNRTGLDLDAWASMVCLHTGDLSRALEGLDSELYPFLMKYGSAQISELDKQPLSRLRKYADGIGRIHERESSKD
jgi:hypothetical protein